MLPDADDFEVTDDLLDYDDPYDMAGFDLAYPVLDDAPEEDTRRTSGRVRAAGVRHANPAVLITAAEAEERYGIPASRIYRWRDRGMLPVRGYRGASPTYAPPEVRTLNRLAELDPRAKRQPDSSRPDRPNSEAA